ncbi:hypothetical protein A361_20760 [Cytobacillus oceanisediminis 2691]|uniref:Uncharacterized protein n=1 Tax=Cytobacillus oceanisediminis 2691 TaxID=1196031 RepID=A0A160MEC1_9BACI|nr:hypothetical protein A361_20760 [Cytobacillus oceanisediminis 2691]
MIKKTIHKFMADTPFSIIIQYIMEITFQQSKNILNKKSLMKASEHTLKKLYGGILFDKQGIYELS